MSFNDWMKELDLICHWNNCVPPTTCGHLLFGNPFDCGNSPLEFFYNEFGTLEDLARFIV